MGIKNYLLIVAHPDDEIIWASSLPKRYPGNWKCYCLTVPQREPDRINYFGEACSILGIGLHESLKKKDYNHYTKLDFDNLHIDTTGIDHIVTHNENGEYGHIHHRQLHDHVLSFTYSKPITYFGYGSKHTPTMIHHLTDDEQQRKLKALKVYKNLHQGEPYYENILRWLKTLENYDFNIETFHGAKL